MKPMGPIPPDFLAGEALTIGGRTVEALIAEAGDTPLFVYDLGIVAARIARFRAAFPAEVALHYAIKANPFAPLVAEMVGRVDGIDVASGGEMARAIAAGMDPAAISFAGPGKRDREIEAAIVAGVTLNLESEAEGARALAIGARAGVRPRLAVRVNPDFEIRGSGMRMGGGAKPFGVDAARAAGLVQAIIAGGAEWRGFHIFAGSQALDAAAIVEAQAATVALAADLADAIGVTPPLVNLGGGFGIPYFPGDAALDVAAVGAALAATLAGRPAVLRQTQFAIELGRWLVGEAGVYLTRIVDRKDEPRRALPRHRWRHAPPARRERQFRDGGEAQLSGGRRDALRCGGEGDGYRRRLPLHPARSPRRQGGAAARRGGRRDRRVPRRRLWCHGEPASLPRPSAPARNARRPALIIPANGILTVLRHN